MLLFILYRRILLFDKKLMTEYPINMKSSNNLMKVNYVEYSGEDVINLILGTFSNTDASIEDYVKDIGYNLLKALFQINFRNSTQDQTKSKSAIYKTIEIKINDYDDNIVNTSSNDISIKQNKTIFSLGNDKNRRLV